MKLIAVTPNTANPIMAKPNAVKPNSVKQSTAVAPLGMTPYTTPPQGGQDVRRETRGLLAIVWCL